MICLLITLQSFHYGLLIGLLWAGIFLSVKLFACTRCGCQPEDNTSALCLSYAAIDVHGQQKIVICGLSRYITAAFSEMSTNVL